MTISRDDILVLTEEVKCSKCNCDCHCESDIHLPSDELDSGGPCTCDDCQCKKAYVFYYILQWVIAVNI